MSRKILPVIAMLVVVVSLLGVFPAAASNEIAQPLAFKAPRAKFFDSVAFDVSPALRDMAKRAAPVVADTPDAEPLDIRPDRGPDVVDNGFSGDGAMGIASPMSKMASSASIQPPLANFEGLSNQDNFNVFGFRVNPPDPVGDVGPNHYVEMINLLFAVYDKTGNLLLGPVDTGTLWAGFPIEDCTDPSGDPIVLYDQFADR